jgi:hypothetical protein
MTSLATTTARPRSGHLAPRAALARVGAAVALAALAVREAWHAIAEDGQFGPSADLTASRASGARA